jgi:hypothetical protein
LIMLYRVCCKQVGWRNACTALQALMGEEQ